MRIDPALIVPDPRGEPQEGGDRALGENRPRPITARRWKRWRSIYGFKMTAPWDEIPEKARKAILYGSGGDVIRFAYDDGLRSYEVRKPFEGVVTNLERRYRETESDWSRDEISRYMAATPCAACGGKRLKPEALAVKIDASDIGDVTRLSVREAHAWFTAPPRAARHQAERDRRAYPQGDCRAVALPARCRAGISHARARLRHVVGRREPAYPP